MGGSAGGGRGPGAAAPLPRAASAASGSRRRPTEVSLRSSPSAPRSPSSPRRRQGPCPAAEGRCGSSTPSPVPGPTAPRLHRDARWAPPLVETRAPPPRSPRFAPARLVPVGVPSSHSSPRDRRQSRWSSPLTSDLGLGKRAATGASRPTVKVATQGFEPSAISPSIRPAQPGPPGPRGCATWPRPRRSVTSARETSRGRS